MTSSTTPRRRSILLGGAATAAAAGLAGCGSSGPSPAASSAPTGADTSAATSGSAASASSAGAAADAIAQTSAVPVGGALYLADHKVIVTQPNAGTFKAFSSVCPHQRCAVSKIEGAVLHCPCHGSEFDLEGQVTKGPATTGLTSEPVTVSGDSIIKG